MRIETTTLKKAFHSVFRLERVVICAVFQLLSSPVFSMSELGCKYALQAISEAPNYGTAIRAVDRFAAGLNEVEAEIVVRAVREQFEDEIGRPDADPSFQNLEVDLLNLVSVANKPEEFIPFLEDEVTALWAREELLRLGEPAKDALLRYCAFQSGPLDRENKEQFSFFLATTLAPLLNGEERADLREGGKIYTMLPVSVANLAVAALDLNLQTFSIPELRKAFDSTTDEYARSEILLFSDNFSANQQLLNFLAHAYQTPYASEILLTPDQMAVFPRRSSRQRLALRVLADRFGDGARIIESQVWRDLHTDAQTRLKLDSRFGSSPEVSLMHALEHSIRDQVAALTIISANSGGHENTANLIQQISFKNLQESQEVQQMLDHLFGQKS